MVVKLTTYRLMLLRLMAVLLLSLTWNGMTVMAQETVTVAASDSVTATPTNRHERRPVIISDTSRLDKTSRPVRVVNAAGDTITFASIDSIRGIKSERVIDNLIDKGLIEVTGRSEGVGRPLIYATTKEFLKKFGYSSLRDLPEVPEYEEMRREREEEGYGQMSIDFEGGEEPEDKENKE